jgi:predicted Rossmann fold nucleotide-binding protein DprA/Smf involved in DNA uptake
VPGEITSTLSAGTNGLLKLGASPLTCAADVLSCFGLEALPARASPDSELIAFLPASADELVRRTGRSAADVARELVELELVGAVSVYDGLYRMQ